MLQGGGACLCTMIHWAPLPMKFLWFLWHHCHPRVVVFGLSLSISVSHFFISSCWSNFLSNVSVSMCGIGKNGHHVSQERHSVFLWPGHDLKSYLIPEKAASVLCLDAVLGKVHLPCWRLIVAMVVMCAGTSIVFCSSGESPLTYIHSSTNTFFEASTVGIQFTCNRPSETFFLFPGALKCTDMQKLGRVSRHRFFVDKRMEDSASVT